MSQKGDKVVNVQENPEDQELSLDHDTLLQYLEKNLAVVLADTTQKTAELERLQELKKQLLNHKFSSLASACKQPFPKGINLLPRLNQVNSKAKELVGHLTQLIDAKANVIKAYDQHCKEAKNVTADQLMSRYDQYTSMSDEELYQFLNETKNALRQILAKIAAKKKNLVSKKKKYQAKHLSMMQETETLTQVEQDSVERLEQLRLNDALRAWPLQI